MEIFSADNFTPYQIKYRKISGSMVNFGKILDNYFSNYRITRISQLDRNEINSENYQIVIESKKGQKKLLLRKNKILSNLEQVNFYLNLLIGLAKQGVPVSEVIRNKKREVSAVVDGNIYSLFKFIEGEHFRPTKKALMSVAEAIARMHKAFNKIDAKNVSRIKKLSGRSKAYFNIIKKYSLSDFKKIRDIIKNKKDKSETESNFLEAFSKIESTIEEVKIYKNQLKRLPVKVIHSDLHPHNILMQEKKVGAIVDFDAVRLSPQGRDVAFVIYRLGRQFFVNNAISDKSQAVRLKNIFLEKYCKIKPLTENEILLLPILLKDDFLKRLLFVLKGIYEQNNLTWAADMIKFIIYLQEIEYFWPDKK
ncbi:MAG: hypothetical protein A2Y98_01060 [Candidatus Portnoybacteria bacterium RBG_19FT_COMBO_36_7]|uniref:Aminoglycoside phosphotransferase domain-containing protein n=1 Tax=Candidatus Portnoybacteria bacterium RBG_19FT_COMBO_36_7 TaxID=1801992 RepID=A0A1G2F8Z3_9BACT|nr:MAG: hypothetical protein A2Y98_01060 [Candidatus Portnoybacteria bacterium RBG_19FT_COMBO_36_7]